MTEELLELGLVEKLAASLKTDKCGVIYQSLYMEGVKN
jgi:hypothetical protein